MKKTLLNSALANMTGALAMTIMLGAGAAVADENNATAGEDQIAVQESLNDNLSNNQVQSNNDNDGVDAELENIANGSVVVVGDSRTTPIEDRLGPDGFSTQLSNRRNGADVIHDALLDVDVHNFSELSALRKAGVQRRHLQSLVNRGLVDFATRR